MSYVIRPCLRVFLAEFKATLGAFMRTHVVDPLPLFKDVDHFVNVFWFGRLRREGSDADDRQDRGNPIEANGKVTRFRTGLHGEGPSKIMNLCLLNGKRNCAKRARNHSLVHGYLRRSARAMYNDTQSGL